MNTNNLRIFTREGEAMAYCNSRFQTDFMKKKNTLVVDNSKYATGAGNYEGIQDYDTWK